MTKLSRRAVIAGMPLALAACGGPEPVWAPQAAVDRVRYRHPGPPMLTLFTMKNRDTGNGAHSGLMINASERVLFDPAGTFGGQGIYERNDVIFGITPLIEQYYMSYHARKTYYVTRQDVIVSEQVAQQALSLALSNGAVGKMNCARSTGAILHQLPGFENVRSTLFPDRLERAFARVPGVTSQDYYEDDADDKSLALENWNREQAGLPARVIAPAEDGAN